MSLAPYRQATGERGKSDAEPGDDVVAAPFGLPGVLHQQRQYRLQMIVGQFLQFVIGPILHRMRHEHIRRVGAQRLRLRGGGIDKLSGGHTDRRNSVGFEIREVMRTARRAGASVSQSFDDDVHLAHDLLP